MTHPKLRLPQSKYRRPHQGDAASHTSSTGMHEQSVEDELPKSYATTSRGTYHRRHIPPMSEGNPESNRLGLSKHNAESALAPSMQSDDKQEVGTFTVPTFKEAKRGRDPPGGRRHHSRKGDRYLHSTDGDSKHNVTEGDSSDEDEWMKEALLHGITVANETTSFNAPLGESLDRFLSKPDVLDMSHKSDSSDALPAVSIQERRRSSIIQPFVLDMSDSSDMSHKSDSSSALPAVSVQERRRSSRTQPFVLDVNGASDMSHKSDSSSALPAVSIQERRRSSIIQPFDLDLSVSSQERSRSSNKGDWNFEEMGNEFRKDSSSSNSQRGLRSTFPKERHVPESEQRRNILANMSDEELATYLMDISNHHSSSALPDAVPPLPLVKTYEVIKSRPNEPAGLFLTKEKNGGVLVHSLSPESLFWGTDLVSGHEVLSVNEKRVNDPKMAATLITQARGRLALRASTAKRPRGFFYCQVKRNGKISEDAAHGLRFVTTNVDGMKMGNPGSEGLVRVSVVDSNGLFAKSHPLNRLRMGSIVLTVNGTPVTNGRKALEIIMGSKQLVEVLHCDERLWRECWLWSSLEEVEGGERKGQKEITNLVFRKDDLAVTSDWSMGWSSERAEVILRKKGVDWAFKLVFNNVMGTCQSEEVEGQQMPPTDDFDVSLFVQLVNEKQRTIMTVLRKMLGRTNFEHDFGSKNKPSRLRRESGRSSQKNKKVVKATDAKSRRKMSYDDAAQMMLTNDDDEDSLDEEMCILVNDLLRVDDRDRYRKHLPQVEMPYGRRGSTGRILPLSSADFDPKDLEPWYLANMGDGMSNEDKLRWIHSRRKRMDEEQNENASDASIRSHGSTHSMFSSGILENLEDYLDGLGSDSDPSYITNAVDANSGALLESPRLDEMMDEQVVSSTKVSMNSTDGTINSDKSGGNVSVPSAYITGVFRDVATKYEVSSVVVGSGGFGEVRECTDKKTGRAYVVKTMTKPPQDDTSKVNLIRNEILLLHEAKHPNIVELKDLFEDSTYVHIVMERCTGGDLFDRVVNENPARIRNRAKAINHESRTANTVKSIIQVIKYLHAKEIVHRDIKPEHFLLTTEKKDTQKIKLIDFGLARKHVKGSPPMTTFTGSPSFVAPEVIARSYDHMCDLFSTGATTYFLLTGMLPFDGPTDEDTFDLISMGEFRFPSSSIHLSDEARDFITKLLKTDPKKRMTAEEALNHPWLKKGASC